MSVIGNRGQLYKFYFRNEIYFKQIKYAYEISDNFNDTLTTMTTISTMNTTNTMNTINMTDPMITIDTIN